MNWAIFTPDECANWDGATPHFTPGLRKEAADLQDDMDQLWRVYYRSIFNPGRVKEKAMLRQMPKKFWKNLPEAADIEDLLGASPRRVDAMLERPASPARELPAQHWLRRLHER